MLQCPKCGRKFDSDVTACPEDGTVLSADPTLRAEIPLDPLVGRVLDDKYRLDARLGEGGMGTVYRATHLLIERGVAVKVLNSRLVTDEAARERFRREARAAGRIQHSNAVAVTDFGETRDGLVYLVMELLEGRPLRDILAREAPLDQARAVSLMLQASAAVAAAHEAGVIHRDLKPGNIFVVQRPSAPYLVKVLDFGIAKLAFDAGDGNNLQDTLTGTGVMIGTPRYMSPEQCDGAQLSPASDVYSLGVILYEMLTGQTPFTGATPLSLALKHSSETPKPPRELVPSIAPALEAFVLKSLEKSPADRYPDAGEFRRELYSVAERLGLEHSAGFSAPTIESVRDAGTETPSGRLVIDIERLRRSRASSALTEAAEAQDTDENEAKQTAGRPSPQAAVERPVVAKKGEEAKLAPLLVSRLQALRAWLTQPLAFVVVLCAALLLIFGGLLLWRSRTQPARGSAVTAGDEAAETMGRELSQAEASPRGMQVREPRTASDFYENATYFFSIRSYDAAVRDFRRAIELQPDFPSAHNRLGRALAEKGQLSAAAEAFRTAIEQRGGKYPTAQFNLGLVLQRQGDREGALGAYRAAIESSGGTNPDAFYQIGSLLLDSRGREQEAAEAFRKAIEQNKGRDPEAHMKLGVAHARRQEYAEAEAAFRESINQRGGDFAYARFNLALLYERTGRLPEAVEEYEKFLEQAPPGDENRRIAQQSIRELRRRVERQGDGQP